MELRVVFRVKLRASWRGRRRGPNTWRSKGVVMKDGTVGVTLWKRLGDMVTDFFEEGVGHRSMMKMNSIICYFDDVDFARLRGGTRKGEFVNRIRALGIFAIAVGGGSRGWCRRPGRWRPRVWS